MQIERITYQRVVNLGNYESKRFEATAILSEDESPVMAGDNLKTYVDNMILGFRSKDGNYEEKPF